MDRHLPSAPKPRMAVLVSGRGSNLQALLDAIARGELAGEIVGVFSDQPECAALQKVAEPLRWGMRIKDAGGREAFDARLADALDACRPDWVVCAGYMRILGAAFVQRFAGRLINIHPSLLPKYKGLHTHQRALDAGDDEHGVSVHWVSAELDSGELIAQRRIPILPGDTPETLAARLLPEEHRLLVEVMQAATSGRLRAPDAVAQA